MTTAHRYTVPAASFRFLTERGHLLLSDLRLLHLEPVPGSSGPDAHPWLAHFRTAADRDGWKADLIHAVGPLLQTLTAKQEGAAA